MTRFLAPLMMLMALAAGPAFAQDTGAARRAELAERLVTLTQGENLQKRVEQQMQQVVDQMDGAPPEQQDWMRANLPPLGVRMMNQMRPRLTALMAETYTEQELEAQIAFYEGPYGASIAEKAFDLGIGMAAIIAEVRTEVMRDLLIKFCAEFDCGAAQPASKPATR